jgi:hypothetical protein
MLVEWLNRRTRKLRTAIQRFNNLTIGQIGKKFFYTPPLDLAARLGKNARVVCRPKAQPEKS